MNSRKILDYVVLTAPIIELTSFLERINLRIETISKEIEDSKSYIDNKDLKYKSYIFMLEIYSKYKFGNEYYVLTDKEIREWKNLANIDLVNPEGKYNHPLEGYKSNTGKIIFGSPARESAPMAGVFFYENVEKLNKNFVSLKKNMENKIHNIKLLEKELKILEADTNPISNKYIRTEIETSVFNLIKEGYEPIGGVSVSYGNYYQAMVKYQE